MRIMRSSVLKSSDITDEKTYLDRRAFFGATGKILVAGGIAGVSGMASCSPAGDEEASDAGLPAPDTPTPFKEVTTYNNFYELGTDKDEPAKNATSLITRPWSVAIEGMVNKPATYNFEDIIRWSPTQERVHRLRCVEGWSMVIPWNGFPLRDLIARVEPMSQAKFVEFTTILDTERLPGQRRAVLDWPYTEGLRLDEAMHPLTILATGLYGKALPNQNGAPLRLVVPWKYGFKSIKSIVRIRFTDTQPATAWNKSAPSEYGFYSNVNPEVDHPRWSQAKERRIGEFRRRATLMFNGYGDEVSSMYTGMDLRRFY